MHLFLKHPYCFKLLLLVALYGCQLQGMGPESPDRKEVTRRDLYRESRSQQKLLLVDSWNDPEYKIKLRQLVEDFHHRDWQLMLKEHSEVTMEEISSVPCILVGTHRGNSWIEKIKGQLPFTFSPDQIIISDKKFDLNVHSLALAYYPNPFNPSMPIGLYTSQDESLIWELINEEISGFFRSNWNYQVLKRNQRVLLGNLSQDPSTRWEVDLHQQIMLPDSVIHKWNSGPFVFSSYHQKINQETMKWLEAECNRQLSEIQLLTGKKFKDNSINYYLYPSTETKGLMVGSTEQSSLDFERGEVHTAFNDHFNGRYFGKENQLILRDFLGRASFMALEVGLAAYFSSTWQQKGFRYWAWHLIDGGNGLTVKQLLDPGRFESSSPLIREALAGSLTEFLIGYWGKDEFLKKYHRWDPDPFELSELNGDWWAAVRARHFKEVSWKRELPYVQGFNFTHEGYQIFNGYGSSLSAGSMDRVKGLGANAVAIVPYGWMRDPNSPDPFRFSDRAGSENDEGVIHAISHAKTNGLITLLKPHIWISGSWPGEVEMSTEADWDAFFENYYNWISHYALLAEMYEVDALCIGVEFSKATLNQEHRWRILIDKLRKIYHGNLTYAANWGEEFENIKFWDQLDFIGLNCYYPLSNQKTSTDEQLQEGFAGVLQKVKQIKFRYSKPVIFTEIGFRSIEAPWIQPHAEAGENPYNEQHQAICYQAVFRAMADHPVVDGILWWKWPTRLEQGNKEDRRFIPAGKQAEKVIEDWFNGTVAKKNHAQEGAWFTITKK